MARQTIGGRRRPGQWRAASACRTNFSPSSHDRRLWLESLEDRRLLAVFPVSNLNDTGGGSLRSAVALANASGGPDTIRFTAALSGGTISLTSGEIEIAEELTIDARPLATNVTIDANLLSRIFNITAVADPFTLAGLNLTGGKTTANGVAGGGGAVRSLSPGLLMFNESTISGNGTTGNTADGGGIFASGGVTLAQSTVSGNSAVGSDSHGGGISARGHVTLTQSTVSGNSTTGGGDGGGVAADGDVTLIESTISGNSVTGDLGAGGGIFSRGNVAIAQSTISGNSVQGSDTGGGGIIARGSVMITQSTVSGNSAFGSNTDGGGIFGIGSVTIRGSIVAENTAAGGGPDLVSQSTRFVNHSLIGTAFPPYFGTDNVSADNPQLAPLADNGGPTQTHAPLAGSPAIDAGDAGIAFNPAEFDQRGAPFVRIADGDGIDGARIDIGSYEVQTAPALTADFDGDRDVDGADFLIWQRGNGATGPAATPANGNADGDNDVDGDDLDRWQAQFGHPETVIAAAAANSNAATSQRAALDAVFAGGDFTLLSVPSESPRRGGRVRR